MTDKPKMNLHRVMYLAQTIRDHAVGGHYAAADSGYHEAQIRARFKELQDEISPKEQTE